MMSGWSTAVAAILRIGLHIISKCLHFTHGGISKGGDIHMWLLFVTETWWLMSGSEVFVTPTGR